MDPRSGAARTLASLTLLLAASAVAAPPNPPQPPAAAAAKTGSDAGAEQLAREDGVSVQEAKRRLDQQREIADFLSTSEITQEPGFVELFVRHKPYQIVLSFDRSVSTPALMQKVPVSLRSSVIIEGNGRSRAAQNASIRELTTALAPLSGKFAVGYSPERKLFLIDTADEAAAAAARGLIPESLRSSVVINAGALPQPTVSTTAVPTGVVAGDWVEAGYGTARSDKTAACTAAFPITFGTSLKGFLTAGHCYPAANTIVYSTHVVTFPDAYAAYNSGNYDYAIFRSDGLSSDYQMYYFNNRGTAGYASSGWLNTKNFVRLANQWVGMYACKSGATTGITCATTSSLNYDWGRPGAVFVRWVSGTATSYIADYGDSGSPTFITLDSTRPSDVSAVGIMVGGHAQEADGYVGVYMPIDRVFDHVAGVKLITSP
ncbi:MAG: S1 family peptidase [Allosphingosinicella sp.]